MKLYFYRVESKKKSIDLWRENLLQSCAADYMQSKKNANVVSAVSNANIFACDGIDFEISRGAHGKPYFAKPPLFENVFFSVSHSGKYWAALFSDSEVGFDIEDITLRAGMSAERMDKIADRFFTGDERRYVLGGADVKNSDILHRFFRIWTAKEAYIKYTGNGISEGLQSFSAVAPPRDVTIITHALRLDIIYSYCSAREAKGTYNEQRTENENFNTFRL